MDAYLGTKAAAAFLDVYRRGGVIAGSSAGATVQGSFLVRGAPEGNHVMMAPGHEQGFGFLPDAAIDQHAIARNRLPDMVPVIEKHPHLLGIAIDEATALVVSGGKASVLGKSKVALYCAETWKNGSPKYFFLEKGQQFEIATEEDWWKNERAGPVANSPRSPRDQREIAECTVPQRTRTGCPEAVADVAKW